MLVKNPGQVCSSLLSTLYSSLGLGGKLADLGGLHSLSEAGVCPAVTGGASVGLVDSNRKVQTLLGFSPEPAGQLRAHRHLRYVGLRPAGGITGFVDLSLTGEQKGGQVGQLGSSWTVSSPSTDQVRLVSLSNRQKLLINCLKHSFLPRLAATSSVLFLHPLRLLIKVGDDVLPHSHNAH